MTLACIDIPALPLQLALREHPDWRLHPVVMVQEDRPEALILYANRPAQKLSIHPGLRFNQAQALSSQLHAAIFDPIALEHERDALFKLLTRFSPGVEPDKYSSGIFWLDASGLRRMYRTTPQWGKKILSVLQQRQLITSVVVGTYRYCIFALARMRVGLWVLENPEEELILARRVPLHKLDLSAKLLQTFHLLGVHTLGDFLSLPADGLRLRYGDEAFALYQRASGQTYEPLEPTQPVEIVRQTLQIEPADDDLTRLLFGIKTHLHAMTDILSKRCEALTALHVKLLLDHAPALHERVEFSKPTLDVLQILELVRLRLSATSLAGPVKEIILEAETFGVHPEQLALLLQGTPKRDLMAAARALARIRAAYGHNSVQRAQLLNFHLPEQSFTWTPTTEVFFPSPAQKFDSPPLIRRFFAIPHVLPQVPRHEPETWLGSWGVAQKFQGPFRIFGQWWSHSSARDYFFIDTTTAQILWVYYDSHKRRWFLQGTVD